MTHVILDCDNTMGIPGRDVDDGVALLYLLGCQTVRLEAVTTTFGNGSEGAAAAQTFALLGRLRNERRPALYRGMGRDGRPAESEAAEFLASEAAARPGRLNLLATGSLSNLEGAMQRDAAFLGNLAELVVMGGVLEPLVVDGTPMDELNLACNHEAAYAVIAAAPRLTIVTGHLCLQAPVSEEQISWLAGGRGAGVLAGKSLLAWRDHLRENVGIGLHLWDLTAAVRLTAPTLFEPRPVEIVSSLQDLEHGMLRTGTGSRVDLPCRILDLDRYWAVVESAWLRVS